MDFVRDFSGGFLGCYKIQNRRFETCSLSITSERKNIIKTIYRRSFEKR